MKIQCKNQNKYKKFQPLIKQEEHEDENVETEIIETEDKLNDDRAIPPLKRDHSHVLSKSSKKRKC